MNPPTPTTDPVQAARAQRDEAQRALALAEAALQRAEVEAERPTVTYDGITYRYDFAANRFEALGGRSWYLVHSADYIRALASLLPRGPVEVTQSMVDKARAAYNKHPSGSLALSLRAALEAVAASLTAPPSATTPALGKPVRWTVETRDGQASSGCVSLEAAFALARLRNRQYVCDAPHRVCITYEVPTDDEQQEAKGS